MTCFDAEQFPQKRMEAFAGLLFPGGKNAGCETAGTPSPLKPE
jgi:hypothetical protein